MGEEPRNAKPPDRLSGILERLERSSERQERTLERQDRLTGETLQEVRQSRERSERPGAKNLAAMDRILAAVTDLGDQVRADTQATLGMLDRLGEDGQTA